MMMLARAFREVGRYDEAAATDGGPGFSGQHRAYSFEEARRGDDGVRAMRPDSPEVEIIVGYVVVKTLGPFLEAFAKKLGEQFAETLSHALSRLRLLLNRRTKQRELDISTRGRITLVLPNPLPDEAMLALLDLDVTDPELQEARLYWDEVASKWTQARQEVKDPDSGDGYRAIR